MCNIKDVIDKFPNIIEFTNDYGEFEFKTDVYYDLELKNISDGGTTILPKVKIVSYDNYDYFTRFKPIDDKWHAINKNRIVRAHPSL